jgi:hypothetical protein
LSYERLTCPGGVGPARGDGLVQVDIAVANLDIEPTGRVDTDPRLVMDRGTLAAIIRERDKTPDITIQTFGHRRFNHELLLPTRNIPSITKSIGQEQQN